MCRKYLLIIFLCFTFYNVYSQNNRTPGPPAGYVPIPPMGYRIIEIWTHPNELHFYEQSIVEKLDWYFNEFRHSFSRPSPTRGYSDGIVIEHGPDIIPFLRDYLLNASFLNNLENSSDNTLLLIAYLFHSLHTYSDPVFHYMVLPYFLDENDIQWFINQIKNKIDEYILFTRKIDRVVWNSEFIIGTIAGYNHSTNIWNTENYGHPSFPENNIAVEIKKYYENRLGVFNLVIDNF